MVAEPETIPVDGSIDSPGGSVRPAEKASAAVEDESVAETVTG